jgi:hypothetical protein
MMDGGRAIQLIVAIIALAFAGSHSSGKDPYLGIIVGRHAASVSLVKVAGKTAVWLGVSTRSPSWIQAGLEGAHPFEYVEYGRDGRQVTIREWPVAHGHVAHVRVVRSGSRWRVIIDSYRSRWHRLRRVSAITVLETNGPAVAVIDGKRVGGG